MERAKCKSCGNEVSYWELKRYNGICASYFAKDVSIKPWQAQKIDQIDLKMNVLTAGLSDWVSFKPGYVQKVACRYEIDLEIITRLYQAGEVFYKTYVKRAYVALP